MSSGNSKLANTGCPRCGCYMTHSFDCNCGAVHSDTCVNCGRFTHFDVTEHTQMAEGDIRCPHGAVEHEHPPEEQAARLKAFFDVARRNARRVDA